MSDYAESINTSDFKYTGEVYFHNTDLETRINYQVKLVLNETNFNFNFAKDDGSDFRLAERSNGSGVFKMWNTNWDKDNEHAVLWFKIPCLFSDVKSTFYAFWGNTDSNDISIPEELGFLFYEDFETTPLLTPGTKVNNQTMSHLCSSTTVGACCNTSDDNPATYWFVQSTDEWNRVDLGVGNEKQIDGLILHAHISYIMVNNFTIFGSNNDCDWDELYSGNAAENMEYQYFPFGEVVGPYRYYKFFAYDTYQPGSNQLALTIIHYCIGMEINPKWTGVVNSNITPYGYLFPSDLSFTTITNPLHGKNSWIMEAGVYLVNDTSCDLSDRAHGFEFVGDENGFVINMMHETRVEHNAIDPGVTTYQNIDQTYGGLEFDSYQEHYIAYYEPEDRVYQRIVNRKSYTDIENKIDRKVEGDTRINNVRLHGRQTSSTNDGAYPSYISWFVIREYDNLNLENLDCSELYIPYENVGHQVFDYKEYTEDLTSIIYQHESSFGGNVYNLSNNVCSSENDVWMSDEDATSSDPIYVAIYFDRTDNLVSRSKIHYDSGHEKFYNASKMSDDDTDVHDRNHWRGDDTSGWAVINFGDDRPIISVFGIKMVSDDLDAGPKNYKFYGGWDYPNNFKLLHEGIFEKTAEWQSVTFINKNPYKYCKFEVIDTYGNNIKVQEWEMYAYVGSDKPKYISQVRLLPADFAGIEDNFPKEISLEGSNDTLNWEEVMPWTNTYTPYISHNFSYGKWQRYSFTNIKGYWHYRLACKDNWGASDGRIIIGGWEMCESVEEANIYRILGGETNDIRQIWTSDNCGFEDEYGLIYIANEKLNIVQGFKLVEEKDISEFYDDINVV